MVALIVISFSPLLSHRRARLFLALTFEDQNTSDMDWLVVQPNDFEQ